MYVMMDVLSNEGKATDSGLLGPDAEKMMRLCLVLYHVLSKHSAMHLF